LGWGFEEDSVRPDTCPKPLVSELNAKRRREGGALADSPVAACSQLKGER
jgi:hypothetical protein